ncbi:MAG: hypothetical protein KF905_13760 [Flavobacteriales bacterium]|nr:hypothetical protein [Flavobacteriales bacterium]
MRIVLLLSLFALLLQPSGTRASHPAAAASDAMVVLSITGLDDAAVARLAKEVGRSTSATLEYSCTWSGVVVLKLANINVSERADVMTMVRRLLTSAGIERGVEFVHVHIEARGVGKC